MEFKNDCATLSFHKQSLRGRVADYVIACHEPQVDMVCLIANTYGLFMKLMANYNDAKVRLVAKVIFEHIPSEERRSYHFGSYASEYVDDPHDFFERHMMKISQRIDDFNEHGSNLVIFYISHIRIQLSCNTLHNDSMHNVGLYSSSC